MVKKDVCTDTNTKQGTRLKRSLIKPYWIFPLFILALVTGMFGGWVRLGWSFNVPAMSAYHGLLMVGGFMGGLITLERTITMKSNWWLIFPLSCGLAVVLLLLGYQTAGTVSLLTGSAGLVAFYFYQMTRHREKYWYILTAGAVFWVIGNLKFLMTGFMPGAVNWWVGFILLTILGERLELTRFLPVSSRMKQVLWVALVVTSLGLALPFHGIGRGLYVVAAMLSTVWFLRNDMARISARQSGYQQYIGVGVLTGYFWLLLHLLVLVFFFENPAGYDLYIHTFFLGFGFSMIWAHAPIILPVVLQLKVRPFHPVIWLFWSVFQLSLLGRILVSMTDYVYLRKVLGMINGLTILAMFAAWVELWFINR